MENNKYELARKLEGDKRAYTIQKFESYSFLILYIFFEMTMLVLFNRSLAIYITSL